MRTRPMTTSAFKKLNSYLLMANARTAGSLTIFSAYYLKRVVEQLAKSCSGNVKIVLIGLGGRRLSNQLEGLKKLCRKLTRWNDDIEIKLAFVKWLFHTKLYMFGDEEVCIGSANATQSGSNGRNEEALLRISPIPKSVLNYTRVPCGRVHSHLSDRTLQSTPLSTFFRTPLPYYKPYAQLLLTLNPL